MAVSEPAPQPVAFYAAVRFLVNATYVALIWDLIGRLGICICCLIVQPEPPGTESQAAIGKISRARST